MAVAAGASVTGLAEPPNGSFHGEHAAAKRVTPRAAAAVCLGPDIQRGDWAGTSRPLACGAKAKEAGMPEHRRAASVAKKFWSRWRPGGS
jgi:hypothetical protein